MFKMFREYKYKVELSRHAAKKQKVTDISWEQLIEVISNNQLNQVKVIRFHHNGSPNGTAIIDGGSMLELWKQVDKKKGKSCQHESK